MVPKTRRQTTKLLGRFFEREKCKTSTVCRTTPLDARKHRLQDLCYLYVCSCTIFMLSNPLVWIGMDMMNIPWHVYKHRALGNASYVFMTSKNTDEKNTPCAHQYHKTISVMHIPSYSLITFLGTWLRIFDLRTRQPSLWSSFYIESSDSGSKGANGKLQIILRQRSCHPRDPAHLEHLESRDTK